MGRLRNVRFEDGKLKGDAHLNLGKINEATARNIRNGGPQDVSTGLFVIEASPGDGSCDLVCEGMNPDHLALVDDGACPWPECGIPKTHQRGE